MVRVVETVFQDICNLLGNKDICNPLIQMFLREMQEKSSKLI